MGGDTWTKTKHTVRPQIGYEYRPEVSQKSFHRLTVPIGLTAGTVSPTALSISLAPGSIRLQERWNIMTLPD